MFNVDFKRIFRSVSASALAGLMLVGSVFTVAAALQTANNAQPASADEAMEKAYTITIENQGEFIQNSFGKGTVADALEANDITLTDDLAVLPTENTQITGDTYITVFKASTASVTADDETKTVKLPQGNVVEALNFLGYNVSEDDELNVDKDSAVKDGMKLTITRVYYAEEKSVEEIPYGYKEEKSDRVDLGETKIGTKGENGLKLVTKKCKYENGKRVSEKKLSEEIAKKPVDEVTLTGTRGAASSGGAGTFVDSNGVEVSYKYVLTGSGTAYTAPAGSGTATGVTAYHGGVAINPNLIPYGSKVYVVSTDGSFVYGYATAVDTGGALMDGSAIVDCFYDTYDECVQFGRRDVNVYIIG